MYYENGMTKYEGNFVDGLYHGEGSLYDSDGTMLFEGRFVRG